MEYQAAATSIIAAQDIAATYAKTQSHPTPGPQAGIRQAATKTRCALSPRTALLCADVGQSEEKAPDSEIIAGGAVSHDVWFIRSGILRLQRYAFDGRRQILSLFLPGEIVGFEGEFRNGVGVETVTQSRLCRIDRGVFDRMLNTNDDLRAEIFRQKQDQLDRLHWLTWSLGALSPEERFCAFLALSTRFMPYQAQPDGSAIVSMQMPRIDIADLLGTTVETICRINRKLAKAGIIEIKDPSHFRIPDLRRLTSLGQIDGSFDRMVRGIIERRYRLDRMAAPPLATPTCF